MCGRCAGLKLHEDWGTTPAAIDACLRVAVAHDVMVTVHTDTLNESCCLEETVAAVGGLLIAQAYTDYVSGGEIPTGQSVIAAGGTFELAGTRSVAANLRFADNTGSFVLATDAGQAATRAAVAGFQNGDTLAASLATGSSFDAASNTLTFLYADGGLSLIHISEPTRPY